MAAANTTTSGRRNRASYTFSNTSLLQCLGTALRSIPTKLAKMLLPLPNTQSNTEPYEHFTLFSSFPYDIRELIWKQALRPHHSSGRKAIHRIKFTERPDKISVRGPIIFSGKQPYFKYRAESFETSQRNNAVPRRSAYLYDAGMWTACKESRRIIAHHNGVLLKESAPFKPEAYYNLSLYPQVDNRPQRLNELSLHPQPRHKVALMTARGSSAETSFQFHVYPHKDVFIIDASDWRMTRHYHSLLYYYPFSPMLGLFNIPPQLAFEYSNTWITDLPRNWHLLVNEPSPRGLLLRILQGCLKGEIRCQVWLIDRVACGRNDEALENTEAKFFDCDGAYVLANLGRLRMHHPSCYTNVGEFVKYLHQALPRAMQGREQYFGGVLISKEARTVQCAS